MKRLAITASAVLMLMLAGALPVAAAGATVETFPVTFTITSAQCSNLPAGTTITGSGMETSITTVRTDESGVTTIVNSTHAQGTATDNLGNTYVFNYANSFRVSNTVATPDTFSGNMTDTFSLAGSGPAHLHNGFSAGLTSNDGFATVTWNVNNSRGDPISFASGPVVAHCDPL
jgi:hypothetical protein